jgi:methionyl-tRNA synthetase
MELLDPTACEREYPYMSGSRYLTTPLYYVNAHPHLGHAYSTLLADTLTRHYRSRGDTVLFLTGTDEHGEKIEKAAAKSGLSPLEFASKNTESFRQAWSALGLKPDVFYCTTDAAHVKLVQTVLQELHSRDEIYFASYSGKYCVGCERFRKDSEWNDQGLCPDHLTPPETREESNYFFRMSRYQDKLKSFFETNPDVIQPTFYRNEVLGYLQEPLEDLCISRPTSRLQWGIPLPFDSQYVTYVWFDALLSYLGGLGYKTPNFKSELWSHATQLIGKDILRTHSIYWSTMLMALGLPLFSRLQVSGYWLTNGLKMSKSLGNIVEPVGLCRDLGTFLCRGQESANSEQIMNMGLEYLRYYLIREMSYGGDASFTPESFTLRCNADLSNGIGNLASRTLTLVGKYLEGKVPDSQGRGEMEAALLTTVAKVPESFANAFDQCAFHKAAAEFAEAVAVCDRYINEKKPWALGKDPARLGELRVCLGTVIEALAILTVPMSTLLPQGAVGLRRALGLSNSETPQWRIEVPSAGTSLPPIAPLYARLPAPNSPEFKSLWEG